MEEQNNSDLIKIKHPKKSGKGQYVRKARGSYKNGNKITVKLFLNKRLKPDFDNGEIYYPTYIQVSLKSQTTVFPALTVGGCPFNSPMSHEVNGEIEFERHDDLAITKEFILKTIDLLKPFERDDFKISELALICTSLYQSIYTVLLKLIGRAIDRFSADDDVEKEILGSDDEFQKFLTFIEFVEENEYANVRICPEFWLIEQYCHLIEKKRLVKAHYTNTPYSLFFDTDFTVFGYFYGNFQKHFINEVGDEIAHKIFDSIDFVLELYFCKQLAELKRIVNECNVLKIY